jgi:hypothetical protein
MSPATAKEMKVKRVGKPAPYLPYQWRCKFACETYKSITAPVWEQVTELELMLLSSGSTVE